VSEGATNERALLVAMPRRHLESAAERCRRDGSAVLPAGGPGELDDVPRPSRVLMIAIDTDNQEVPAATRAAAFQGRVSHQEGEPWPAGLPPTWVDEHPVARRREARFPDADEDDDGPDHERVGPQAFFRVRGLEPLPRSEWVFANEVVQSSSAAVARFPRVPTLVTLPT